LCAAVGSESENSAVHHEVSVVAVFLYGFLGKIASPASDLGDRLGTSTKRAGEFFVALTIILGCF
jgi:hypothetical protein